MARIRTIKPTFFTSLTIADLTLEQRLTFIGLWTHVDDDGRCVADGRLIKAALWPLDDRTAGDVEKDLAALTDASLIVHYEVGGRRYLQVSGWSEHQVINRPRPSTLPPPPEGQNPPPTSRYEGSRSAHGSVTEPSPQEGKGREGNREVEGEQGITDVRKHENHSVDERRAREHAREGIATRGEPTPIGDLAARLNLGRTA